MIVFPHAKINIGLKVMSIRDDGFHVLESIFYPIPLRDCLEIIKSEKFSFESSGLEIKGNVEDNLIIKAFKIIQKDFDIQPVKIHLHKVIPMGAGLGGGSSNAAFTLLLLKDLFELNIPSRQLHEYALELGSDCPFFLSVDPKFVTGRGEILSKTELSLNGFYIKLINPGIHISTSEAFASLGKIKANSQSEDINLIDFEYESALLINDFERGARIQHPEINQALNSLNEAGAFYCSMTGTGSSVYGVFKHKPEKPKNDLSAWVFELK